MDIGKRIRAAREAKGISQEELANAAHTTKQTIYKYEKGIVTKIPSDKIEAIAAKLDVTERYLMGWLKSKEDLDVLCSKLNSDNIDKVVRYAKGLLEVQIAEDEIKGGKGHD